MCELRTPLERWTEEYLDGLHEKQKCQWCGIVLTGRPKDHKKDCPWHADNIKGRRLHGGEK